MPINDAKKEAWLWNARAKYLRSCSKETVDKIVARSIRYEEDGMNKEAALDLAIHQQRTCDWIEQHPREKEQETIESDEIVEMEPLPTRKKPVPQTRTEEKPIARPEPPKEYPASIIIGSPEYLVALEEYKKRKKS